MTDDDTTADGPDAVWIGEAYDVHGDRVERAVHINEAHARHDIGVLAECNDDAVRTVVERERLHDADGEVPA